MRILSGIQPSGKLHLGNYFGMMQRMIHYQNNHDLFCFIVNLHALTTVFDGKTLQENTQSAVADFLALGLDPMRCTFWVQSDVPMVTELLWYLSNHTPVGLLERCTSYKEKVDKGLSASQGLFSYPVLMAADILLFQAERIPVGKDQKQHLEVARDIAIKFNHVYGETFVVPTADIGNDSALIPGLDGQKMSKSYNNTIDIFASDKEIQKKIMAIKTDSKGIHEPKDPETCLIYQLYKLFANQEKTALMADKLRCGGYGYGDAKKDLAHAILETFGPLKEKREKIFADKKYLSEVMDLGAKKASAIALKTIEIVRQKVGVI
jgi:tryptophanyl-tRNA synthetase